MITFFEEKKWNEFIPFLFTGIPYCFSFLGFLTFHEFGHYIAARIHKIRSSLPYYIPFFIPLFPINIGSMGAVIRLREAPVSTRQYFDIGIAGPLAGFVISFILLTWGFTHLPEPQAYILNIHQEYKQDFGGVPTEAAYFKDIDEKKIELTGPYIGTNLLFEILKYLLVSDLSQYPPFFELMHYPFLVVGFMTLFFTALNLLPIGQLDGGHVIFGMFGQKVSGYISRITVSILILVGGLGYADISLAAGQYRFAILGFLLIYMLWSGNKMFPRLNIIALCIWVASLVIGLVVFNIFFGPILPSPVWLIYSFIALRFLGVDHPPVLLEQSLNPARRILGWIAILIFFLCFSPSPLFFLDKTGAL